MTTGNNGAPVSSSAPSTSGIGNARPMYKTRTMLARVLSGAGQGKILLIGDSTTTGISPAFANSGSSGGMARSPAAVVAKLLAARGIPARSDSFYGTQGSTINASTLGAYYPALSVGANCWNGGFSGYGFTGWNSPTASGAAADTVAFTPAGAFDTLEIYTPAHSGWGSVAVNVDGGSTVVTINENQGANTFQKTTQAVTRVTGGTHVINQVGTGNAYFNGLIAYDSTSPTINCVNLGWTGGSVANLASQNTFPWDPNPVASATQGLGVFAPDLVVFFLGLNDLPGGQGTSVSAFIAGLTRQVQNALFTGDCVLMTMWGNAIGTDANTQIYNAAIKQVAVATGVPYIDQWPLYGTNTHGVAIGLMGADGTHPTPAGYYDRSNVLADFIANLT